jgi:ElaB/YqjD/DUF883 family membrane-anchored ribosome-binding protein
MNDRKATSEHTAEELIRNIQKLMAEVEEVIANQGDNVRAEASSKLEELQSRLSSASNAVAGFYRTARRRVSDGAQVADETIRTHPYESLAVALGLGVVLGALLRRSD